ncbi:hypothetical protein AGR56_13935 [Clostridium sp. DMHC 10]|uniref:hypothetical protein n=1 Tax=Clostridium sp. DMHC 10 TaxID=747377 RepID=UPI00069F9B74|nr:hypothetical protein [Clostridium sp. DMHC 10]KOF57475.1 hypothetical protein AGR56_13935 [Clostridium sp. DMHC 10]
MNQEVYVASSEISTIVKETIGSITDYLKHREIEKTERERVRATLRAVTAKFENDRKMFELYLNKSFDERARLYESGEKLLQKAMKDQDIETTKLALNFMLSVYDKNPIDGFSLEGGPLNMSLLSNRL